MELRFDRYMEACLYGPGGFYAAGGSAGRRRGDFLTSPEVGPLFGAVLHRALDSLRRTCGEPDEFTVYDVGAGPGTLLRTISVALDDEPSGAGSRWRLIGVDRVESKGADVSELPDDLTGAVVVSNELLDNIPFRIVERTADGLCEVAVAIDESTEQAAEVLAATDLEPTGPLDLPVGTRAPVHQQAAAWVQSVLDRNPIGVLAFDYGAASTRHLAERGGWLRTYQGHERAADPYAAPGTCDITTDVAFDQFPPPTSLETQADFLKRWGIDDLVEEGRQYWLEHASRPDLRALRMRSRITEVEALVGDDALGPWMVASWLGPTLATWDQ